MDRQDALRQELDGLEREWRRLGAPIADGLQPGLALEAIDQIAEVQGWTIPYEFRVLWNWRNGADPSRPRSIGPGGYEFLSLQEALSETARQRELFPDTPQYRPAVWQPYWLVVMTQGPQRLYADCRTDRPFGTPGIAPLGLAPLEWEDADLARARSLLEATALWRWLLEAGYYHLSTHGELELKRPYVELPLWIRLNGLA